MILTESVLNAYINANIMLIFAYGLWSIARYTSEKFRFKLAYIFQLRLLNGIFLAIALSPFAILSVSFLIKSGLVSQHFSMSVSDFAVAQYLNGSIEMKATEFEQLLGMRETFIQGFLYAQTNLGTFIAGFIGIGTAAIIIRSIYNALKLRSILRSCYEWRTFGTVKLLLCDTTFVPFSTRSFRTRYVIIPSGMLAQSDDLKMALGHEFQHMRQGDVEWEFILEILKPFFFWNPVFFFWKRQVQQLRELACDQELVSRRKFDLQAYCECLLNVCANSIRKDDKHSIALPTVPLVQINRSPFGLNSATLLKERVNAIVAPVRKQISPKAFTCILVPCMALVILASLAIQKPSDWSQDRLMLSTIVNLERLEARTGVKP